MNIYSFTAIKQTLYAAIRHSLSDMCLKEARSEGVAPTTINVLIDASGAAIPDIEKVRAIATHGWGILSAVHGKHNGGYVYINHVTGNVNWVVMLANNSLQAGYIGSGFEGNFYRTFLQELFEQVVIPNQTPFITTDEQIVSAPTVEKQEELKPYSLHFRSLVSEARNQKDKLRLALIDMLDNSPGGSNVNRTFRWDEEYIASLNPQLTFSKSLGSAVINGITWKGGSKDEIVVKRD